MLIPVFASRTSSSPRSGSRRPAQLPTPRRTSRVLLPPDVATADPRTRSELQALLEGWAVLWGVPQLAQEVGLRISTRLRRSLGTYRPSSRQITLAAWLLDEAPRALLEEVLCHEAAHAAVHFTAAARAERGAAAEADLRADAHADARRDAAPHHGTDAGAVADADGRSGARAVPSRSAASPLAKLRERLTRRGREGRPPRAPRGKGVQAAIRDRSPDRARVRPRPHGREWKAFMAAAGFPARVRIPEAMMPESIRAANRASRRWEHRCPVCQATRMARTRMTRWRCRRCVEAGRSGRLVIGRVG